MTLRIIAAAVLALAACQHPTAQQPSNTTTASGTGSQPANGGSSGGSTTGSTGSTGATGGDTTGSTGGGTTGTTTSAPAVVSLAIAAGASVPQGAQVQLTATALWSDGSSTDVTAQAVWSTSDAAVSLEQSADGLEWAVGAAGGSATVSATYAAQSASATVAVTAPALTELALTRADVSIAAGTSTAIGALGLYTDGSRRDVTAQAAWVSSDPAVASLGSGVFSGASTGSATVSASLGGLSASTGVTVSAATLSAIDVSPDDVSIAAGTAQAYTATGIFSDYSTQDLTAQVSWASSQGSATVSGNLATGVSAGTSSISATLLGVTGATTLTVTDAALTGVEISPIDQRIPAGTACAFAVSGLFSDGSVQDLTAQATWTSSDGSVAQVVGGAAQGLAAGATTIAASFGGFSDSTTLTVTAASLTSISVAAPAAPLPVGTSARLAATGAFSDGSTQDLSAQALWASSNPAVVAVDADGTVHAVATGSAQVFATLLGKTGSAQVTVSSATLASIAVGPANPAVPVKYWTQLTATGTFSDGSTVALTGQAVWTSSATSIASVGGQSGVVTGLAAGSSTITARWGGVSGAATLTVMNTKLSSISLAPATLSLAAGTSGALVATGTFANGFSMDVTQQVRWSSSNKGVAAAGNSQRGVVRAVSAGSATVTASRGNKSGTASVTVF